MCLRLVRASGAGLRTSTRVRRCTRTCSGINLGTGGIGSKEVSIPVNEIEPQTIDEDDDGDPGLDLHLDVNKNANPTSVNFANTCEQSTDSKTARRDDHGELDPQREDRRG